MYAMDHRQGEMLGHAEGRGGRAQDYQDSEGLLGQGAECACRASGYYGRIFKAWKGVTQGEALSPTIFNFVVDTIVRKRMR